MAMHLGDRILLLGRPSSGKSVFLSVLYHQLWEGNEEISARACDGATHEALLRDFQSLIQGEWLPATQALRPHDLELKYKGRVFPFTVLDYPGEIYRAFFFENRLDSEELQTFYEYIDRAMAVILLIDPGSLSKDDIDEIDIEYSAIQVIEYFREDPKHSDTPIVIVYTKKDVNHHLIKHWGGLSRFTRKLMPQLRRKLYGIPLVHLAAVDSRPLEDGRRIPVRPSPGDQVLLPIKLVLDQIMLLQYADQIEKSDDKTKKLVWLTSVVVFMLFFWLGKMVAN